MKTNNALTTRIVLDILLFISVIQGWWFIAILLGIFGLLRLPFYIEIIFAGIFYDFLFGIMSDISFSSFTGTIASTLVTILVILLNKKLR